jgi:endoglucanase
MARTSRRRAAVAVATIATATLTAVSLTAIPAQADTTEHVSNGTFTGSVDPWWGTSNLTLSASGGQLCTQVPSDTTNLWDASVGYNGVPLVKGDKYTLKFDASASVAATVKANVQLGEEPYTATLARDTALTSRKKSFTYTFTSTIEADSGTLTFQLGAGKAYKFCLDNVSLTSETAEVDPNGPERVQNGTFDDGTNGWFSYETETPSVTSGKLCAVVPTGLSNIWDAGIGQSGIVLTEGSDYTLSFDASASPAATVRASVQLGEEPYTAYYAENLNLTTKATKHTTTFTASESTDLAQVVFQIGGASDEFTFCVDNVSLRGGEA